MVSGSGDVLENLQTGPENSEFIRCPGCEMPAPLFGQFCPECHRCLFCGSRRRKERNTCPCWQADDPREVELLLRRRGIPVDQVEVERRRVVIRKELQAVLVAFGTLLSSVFMTVPQAMLRAGPGKQVGLIERLLWGLIGAAASYLITIAIRPYFRRIENERLAADLKERPIESAASEC